MVVSVTAERNTPGSVNLSAAPFLKWPGGKGQLLPVILPLVPEGLRGYIEPFVGGGALFFALQTEGRIEGIRAGLNDANVRLANTYRAVRDDVEGVIEELGKLARLHDPSSPGPHFYTVRTAFNDGPLEPDSENRLLSAARLIYLNRTCFNGLYRENETGQFNVSVGSYKNPTVCDASGLRDASAALQHTSIGAGDFTAPLRLAALGTFVYLDPPYAPTSATANFTGYGAGGFSLDRQRDLARECARLTRQGVWWLASNSWTPFALELYGELAACFPGQVCVRRVQARRNINRAGNKRGPVFELLAGNVPGLRDLPSPREGE